MKQIFETSIPFSGCYETKWCPSHQDPTDDQGDPLPGNLDSFEGYLTFLGNAYTKVINDDFMPLGMEIKFTGHESPSFYNFGTDRLFGEVSRNTVNMLRGFAQYKVKHFEQYLIDNFRSRDGFFSHYPDQLQRWLDDETDDLDLNEVGAYLEFYLIHKAIETAGSCDQDLEWQIFELLDDKLSNYVYQHYEYEQPEGQAA